MKKLLIAVTLVSSLILTILIGIGFLVMSAGTKSLSSASYSGADMMYAESARVSPSIGIPNLGISGTSAEQVVNVPVSPDQTYTDMYFMDYGTNVFVQPTLDPLSTFALDVDTGSYTIAKNYIMRGQLPPTDAVRPEEFINYFEYDYPEPDSGLNIYSESAPSPFEDRHYLLIGINSYEPDVRLPAVLTFVIDVSGSMNTENRLALVKKSLRFLVENLEEGDIVGIVKYDTTAALVLEHTSIDDKQSILDAIDTLAAGGSTNAEAGLKMGYERASMHFDENSNNRVILLSDGVANVGNTGPDSIMEQIKDYKDQGIAITTIGVGMGNYNDVLLEQLADTGNGNYYYINEFNEAKRVFSRQLTGTLQTIASDAKVQVEFDKEDVKRYRLIGYENRDMADSDFDDETKDAGEIGAGHEVTAIYELELAGDTIGKVTLRYKDTDGNQQELSEDLTDEGNSFSQSSSRFKKAVAVSRFAQILKLTAPPPSIETVSEIIEGLEFEEYEQEFTEVFNNAKRLIELRQGE